MMRQRQSSLPQAFEYSTLRIPIADITPLREVRPDVRQYQQHSQEAQSARRHLPVSRRPAARQACADQCLHRTQTLEADAPDRSRRNDGGDEQAFARLCEVDRRRDTRRPACRRQATNRARPLTRASRPYDPRGRAARLRVKLIEQSYGADHLDLVLATAYIASLLDNARVVRHLAQSHADLLQEFQKIAELQKAA